MPTPFGHSIFAFAVKPFFNFDKRLTLKIFLLVLVCTIFPDIDVKAFDFGIPYGHPFGHRGFTHSIFFSILLGILFAFIFFNKQFKSNKKMFWLIASYFILCTFSHTFFDMMTNGGKGCAVFAPFDNSRYFLPFRPIKVAPFTFKKLLGERGIAIIKSEFLFLWLPSIALYFFGKIFVKTFKANR